MSVSTTLEDSNGGFFKIELTGEASADNAGLGAVLNPEVWIW